MTPTITLDIRQGAPGQALLQEACVSLEAAIGRARQYSPATQRTIRLGAGRYVLNHTLALDARDAGLTIEAAAGVTPVLYGGAALSGWEPDGDRFWSAPAPGTAEGAWDFRQLYVNGEARPRARLPETGTWPHASIFDHPWLATTGGGFQPPPSAEQRSTLLYREGQLPADFALQNAECVILHSWDESQARVRAHDPAARTLRLDPPCGYPPGAFGIQEYYVLNLREGMTRPGQWYLDRARGRVVYWPLPDEDPTLCAIEAPALHTVLRIEGCPDTPVANLTLRGLTVDLCGVRLAPSGWGAGPFDGAVMLQHVRQCRLEHLTVRRAGGQGIKINDADDTTIQHCDVAHTGANGIVFHRGARNAILDTRVQDAGEIYPSACGINASCWTRGRIARNAVSDCAYCGITLGNGMREQAPAENVVEDNHVWNVMTGSNDGGCLYFYGIERGTVVRGNRLHGARGRTGGYAMGLYLDEHVEDMLCEDNLVYDIGGYPLLLHMTKRNVMRHNIFVCGPGRQISLARSRDCVCEHNIFYAPNTGIQFIHPAGARFAGNLYFPGSHPMTAPPLDANGYAIPASTGAPAPPMPMPPLEDNPLIADPLFENPAQADFRLRPDSPAWRLGFRPMIGHGVGQGAP